MARDVGVRAGLLCVLAAHGASAAAPARVHTVFCAECTNNFDYKSLGVFWSHALSGMPGNVTRLLACSEEQLTTYKGLHLGPTFVHKNHARIDQRLDPDEPHSFGSREHDSSPSYNKPGSIMHWVHESEEAKHVDYVLYIDADMLLRAPMDPVAMGVRKGVVVSEHVGYMDVGLRNNLQAQFLPEAAALLAGADVDDRRPAGPDGKRHASAGWYHFFHIDDIRTIAHRWLYYCKKMRLHPELYWLMKDPKTGLPGGADHDIPTGDAYVGHGQAPWISEMYGYVFAAAEAGLRHILTHGTVVYPDEIGAGQPNEPSIIHYGLHCTVGDFHFTKYTHAGFNAVGCTGALFGVPPEPAHLERLCAETVLTLNDAMCDYYARSPDTGGCELPAAQRPTCPHWKAPKSKTCADTSADCHAWSSAGECTKNPGFMLGACPKSCDQCTLSAVEKVPAWKRGLAVARGEPQSAVHIRFGALERSTEYSQLATTMKLAKREANAKAGVAGAGIAPASLSDGPKKRARGGRGGALAAAIANVAAADGVASASSLLKPLRSSRREPDQEVMRQVLAKRKARDFNAGGDAAPAAAAVDDAHAGGRAVDSEPEPRRSEAPLGEVRTQMYAGWLLVIGLCVGALTRKLRCGRKVPPKRRSRDV